MVDSIKDKNGLCLDLIKKMPLGALVKRFNNRLSPGDRLSEELDNMVFFRNQLAHRIADTILQCSSSEQWMLKVTEELNEIASLFEETLTLLSPYIEYCCETLGVTHSEVRMLFDSIYPNIGKG